MFGIKIGGRHKKDDEANQTRKENIAAGCVSKKDMETALKTLTRQRHPVVYVCYAWNNCQTNWFE